MEEPSNRCRQWVVDFGPLVVVLGLISVATLSSSIARWWSRTSDPTERRLPRVVERVLEARPESASDADLHAVMWFVAGLALVWALRRWPPRALAVGAAGLWLVSTLLEYAQRWSSSRSSQWVDLVGNLVGIVAGIAVGLLVARSLLARNAAADAPAPTELVGSGRPRERRGRPI